MRTHRILYQILYFLILWSWKVYADLVILDDTNPNIRYSNIGPPWKACNSTRGGCSPVVDAGNDQASSHSSLGDGASVTLDFTGTRISMNGTIAKSAFPTRLDIFIDDQQVSTYINTPSASAQAQNQTTNRNNFRYQTTFADIGGLDPGQHTFRAQSVGADCLFVLDSITYDPNNNEFSPSSSVPSLDPQETSFSDFDDSSLSLSPSPASASTSTPSPSASTTGGQVPVTDGMDVTPSDAKITYSPPGNWVANAPARRSARLSRRATSCHDGTRTSSRSGDSLTYNFNGTSIQVYTISNSLGGNYSLTIDGQSQGTFTSYDPTSLANSSSCSTSSLFSTTSLQDTQHSLVLTVQGPSNSADTSRIEFVGFKIPQLTTQPPPPNMLSKQTVALIVGVVTGGAVVLGILGLITVCFLKRRRLKHKEEDKDFEIASVSGEKKNAGVGLGLGNSLGRASSTRVLGGPHYLKTREVASKYPYSHWTPASSTANHHDHQDHGFVIIHQEDVNIPDSGNTIRFIGPSMSNNTEKETDDAVPALPALNFGPRVPLSPLTDDRPGTGTTLRPNTAGSGRSGKAASISPSSYRPLSNATAYPHSTYPPYPPYPSQPPSSGNPNPAGPLLTRRSPLTNASSTSLPPIVNPFSTSMIEEDGATPKATTTIFTRPDSELTSTSTSTATSELGHGSTGEHGHGHGGIGSGIAGIGSGRGLRLSTSFTRAKGGGGGSGGGGGRSESGSGGGGGGSLGQGQGPVPVPGLGLGPGPGLGPGLGLGLDQTFRSESRSENESGASPDSGFDTSTNDLFQDRRISMTLSSYRERVLERADSTAGSGNGNGNGNGDGNGYGTRTLSLAEANAISMRLMDLLKEKDLEHEAEHERQQGQGQGGNIIVQRKILTPPQELVDTLVEEHLKPRTL